MEILFLVRTYVVITVALIIYVLFYTFLILTFNLRQDLIKGVYIVPDACLLTSLEVTMQTIVRCLCVLFYLKWNKCL